MGIGLNNVKAWSDPDQLEPGPYLVQPLEATAEESSNKNPQVKVEWRVVGGPFKGAEKADWVTFTEPAMGRVVQLLEACEIALPEADFDSYEAARDWVLAQLKEKQPKVTAIVRNKPDRKGRTNDDGSVKEWPEIAGYRKPSEGDLDNDASEFAANPVKQADEKPPPF